MGICSDSQNVRYLRITWRAWKRENRVLGPPQRFWFSRSRVGPENFHFYKGPRWCWCCWPRDHSENHWNNVIRIRNTIYKVLDSKQPPSECYSPISTSILHVLKAKEMDDKNELMTLDLNEIELNAIIFGQGFSGSKPKEIFLWK